MCILGKGGLSLQDNFISFDNGQVHNAGANKLTFVKECAENTFTQIESDKYFQIAQ